MKAFDPKFVILCFPNFISVDHQNDDINRSRRIIGKHLFKICEHLIISIWKNKKR